MFKFNTDNHTVVENGNVIARFFGPNAARHMGTFRLAVEGPKKDVKAPKPTKPQTRKKVTKK